MSVFRVIFVQEKFWKKKGMKRKITTHSLEFHPYNNEPYLYYRMYIFLIFNSLKFILISKVQYIMMMIKRDNLMRWDVMLILWFNAFKTKQNYCFRWFPDSTNITEKITVLWFVFFSLFFYFSTDFFFHSFSIFFIYVWYIKSYYSLLDMKFMLFWRLLSFFFLPYTDDDLYRVCSNLA